MSNLFCLGLKRLKTVLIILNEDKNFLRQTLMLSCCDNMQNMLRLLSHKEDNRSVINHKEVATSNIHSQKPYTHILLIRSKFAFFQKCAYINDNLDKKLFFYDILVLVPRLNLFSSKTIPCSVVSKATNLLSSRPFSLSHT